MHSLSVVTGTEQPPQFAKPTSLVQALWKRGTEPCRMLSCQYSQVFPPKAGEVSAFVCLAKPLPCAMCSPLSTRAGNPLQM